MWYSFKTHRTQYVPEDIKELILEEYGSYAVGIRDLKEANSAKISLPSIYGDWSCSTFVLSGLTISMHNNDVGSFYDQLKSYKGHTCYDGSLVYILKGQSSKIWLTKELKLNLIELMEPRLEECNKLAWLDINPVAS